MIEPMVHTQMNQRWDIILPHHRAMRPINSWWEAQRLAATHARIHALTGALGRKPRVLDVGAEEGDFPCLYSLWGAEVFLVEPNPLVWPWIKRTFDANRQVPKGLFVGLLGSPEQVNNLEPTFRGDWPECAFDDDPTPEHGFQHLHEHGEVSPVWTLDMMLNWSAGWTPDIVAMDIEGGELHCLMGADRTLREHRPELFISIHPEFLIDLYGQSEHEVKAFLADRGYRLQFICEDHERHYHAVPLERPWPWADPHRHQDHVR